jgi:hypothetical protein
METRTAQADAPRIWAPQRALPPTSTVAPAEPAPGAGRRPSRPSRRQ